MLVANFDLWDVDPNSAWEHHIKNTFDLEEENKEHSDGSCSISPVGSVPQPLEELLVIYLDNLEDIIHQQLLLLHPELRHINL